MMKFGIWLLILGLTAPASAVRFRLGGDDVGNGGGLAEKNILTAYTHLARYGQLCLELESCRLTNHERRILKAIVKAMPREHRRQSQVAFASERRSPGTFIIDDEVKVARTGSSIGSPVYVNGDLLYTKNALGVYEAVTLAQSVAILIHEFGHHVSKASHAELDLLGVKVSALLQNQIQSTPVLPWSNEIEATVVQGSQAESFPQILLTVGPEVWDLSEAFADAVFCPVFTLPIPLMFPDLEFGKKKPLGVVFHNIHWEKADKEAIGGDFTILGNVTHVCPTGTGKLSLVNSFRARIKFSTLSEDGPPALDPESVTISQSYEPWYKLILFNF